MMMKKGTATADRAFNAVNVIFLVLILLLVAYPIYFVFIASISDPNLVSAGKVWLYPRNVQWMGYEMLLQTHTIWLGYRNTVVYTLVGTLINMVVTLPAAYALSSKRFPSRRIVMFLFTFAMIFQGGIIPTYLIVKSMNMLNTIWALTIPTAYNVFNLIVARSYFDSLPGELSEAATIDGCTEFQLFIRVVLPLSSSMMAVLALYYGVGHWNNYFNALIYISDNTKFPLQVYLRDLLILNQKLAASDSGDAAYMEKMRIMAELIKYGAVIVASIPLMIIYPFVQKYFVKGVLIGAVKG